MALTITNKNLYERNKGFLYSYNQSYFKLVVCRSVRRSGWEERKSKGKPLRTAKGAAGNDSKLSQNIRRAKGTVFELAMCNDWEYFVTLTFDPKKVTDRYALDGCVKQFRKWLNNYNSRRPGAQVKYLLIPEKHKDGAFHLHGLLRGIPVEDLSMFNISDRNLPAYIRGQLAAGVSVRNWIPYAGKFGFCTVCDVRSQEGVAHYITKYITKDLHNTVSQMNLHMYYASRGLCRRKLVYSGPVLQDIEPDFSNDYVSIKKARSTEELLPYFCDTDEECSNDLETVDASVVDLLQAGNHQGHILSSTGNSLPAHSGGLVQ